MEKPGKGHESDESGAIGEEEQQENQDQHPGVRDRGMKYVLNGVGEGVGDLLLRQVPQRTPPAVEVLHVAGAAVVDVWSEHGTAPLGLKHTHTHTQRNL